MWKASLLFVLLLIFAAPESPARERIALVIGNAGYQFQPLDTPLNDARDMAAALRDSGFRVTLKLDADLETMENAILDFGRSLNADSEALFYYAGHGAQSTYTGRENYLLPIGAFAEIRSAGQLKRKAVAAGLVKDEMEMAGSALNIIILDACRNAPFRGLRGHAGRGLGRMAAGRGALIAYSTAPGRVAKDVINPGDRNSPYTTQLLKFMRQPGLSVEQVLKNTLQAVDAATHGEQTPWYESALVGSFYFVPGSVLPQTARLIVRSNQYGDKVWIDGKAYGPTPVEAELPVGRHQVRVTKEGFEDFERWVQLQGDDRVVAQLEPEPEAGLWRDPFTGLEFARIKGDCFQMGSPASEAGRADDENQHQVCVNDFWLATTEVTNAQYRLFKAGHDSKSYQGHSLNGDNQPAVYVSWEDAVAFTEWLNRRHNGRYQFRLPTEAEWEYAARAGTRTARYWGESEDAACRYANVHDRTSKQAFSNFTWEAHGCTDGYAVTAPVGRFQPNGFGLYDMLGNVFEWTCSEYQNPYGGKETECLGKNHASQLPGLRGGSWDSDPRFVRAADRYSPRPHGTNDYVGFRPLRTF